MPYKITGTNVITDTDTMVFSDVVVTTLRTPSPYSFQGSTTGYVAGGSAGSTFYNTIDKYPFAISSGTATDVGDLTNAGWSSSGSSSFSHGYQAGSNNPAPANNVIQKFSFAVDANATDVGDLTQARSMASGSHSSTHGYAAGGNIPSFVNVIDKYTFSADANATDVGDLLSDKGWHGGGNSSLTHGYSTGNYSATNANVIQKFSFSVDANATDVGDLINYVSRQAGASSTSDGYVSGGYATPASAVTPGSPTNVIQKFSFSSDANATDVGDLSSNRNGGGGQSSETHGFTSGGFVPPQVTTIDKFPFASDANASSVGSLTQARQYVSSNNMV